MNWVGVEKWLNIHGSLPKIQRKILQEFTDFFTDLKTHKGYCLLAVDGSSLNIAHDPTDVATHFQSKSDTKGFNLLHLNSMYDVLNKIYVDAVLQPGRKENENPTLYKFLPSTSTFDFLDLHKNKFYPMNFRVVRFKITEDTYETLITNLSAEEFSSEELKELYHMRWGIETSFRELKYAIGLTNFHAKKWHTLSKKCLRDL